jgi:hypothetical protein
MGSSQSKRKPIDPEAYRMGPDDVTAKQLKVGSKYREQAWAGPVKGKRAYFGKKCKTLGIKYYSYMTPRDRRSTKKTKFVHLGWDNNRAYEEIYLDRPVYRPCDTSATRKTQKRKY